MRTGRLTRRGFVGAAGALALGAAAYGVGRQVRQEGGLITVYTFGDSILDCGWYNEHGVHPGALIVRNDDRLFPEFRGQDLSSRGPARLEHRAQDGAVVGSLPRQGEGLQAQERAVALLTIGGNDLLGGLILDTGPGIAQFGQALEGFVRRLPIRPVLIGNVYDPSFGDDRLNFLGVDPKLARRNHERMNAAIAEVASRYGELVDLHAHFLRGDPSWLTRTIEPSLTGASEIRRLFLRHIEDQDL